MRRILLFTGICLQSLLTMSQTPADRYAAAWKRIEELAGPKRLPETALKEVRSLYEMAKRDANQVHQVRAILYMGRLTLGNEEDALPRNIAMLEQESAASKGARKALLHSMTASAYRQFLQENRWTLYDRSRTTVRGEDMRTWSAEDLHAEITRHHLQALEGADLLQSLRTADFEPLLSAGNSRSLRPTLYDVIAHAALEYFLNDEKDLDRQGDGFRIEDPAVLLPAEAFARHRFTIRDSGSLHARALGLYQELTRRHLADRSPEALADLDLNRLRDLHAHSVMDEKDRHYREALQKLAERYPKLPTAAMAAYLRLKNEQAEAVAMDRGAGEAWTQALPRIRRQCMETIGRHPGSEGALRCRELLQELDGKTLSLQMEKVNLPDRPMRCLVEFRNTDILHYRVIALTEAMDSSIDNRNRDDRYWSWLRGLKPAREATQALPVTADLRSHSAEVRIEALPRGSYALLASTSPDFSGKEGPLSVLYFHVSGIAWVNRAKDYFALDRDNGRPLHRAEVTVLQQTYDYSARGYRYDRIASVMTDLDGRFQIPVDERQYGMVRLDVRWNEDRLFLRDGEYRAYSDDKEWTRDRKEYELRYKRVFLFTDRSIYRPGQTVHFKGIAVTRDFDTRRPKTITETGFRISLQDANHVDIDTLDRTSSAYGTFSGSFRLPETGLTGRFHLTEEGGYGTASISVEEYKRPVFQVELAPPARESRLNDTVSVTGTATAYAGNAVNDAAVRYRVTRIPRFPYPWLFYDYTMPGAKSVEIASGTATTGKDGTFAIGFKAVPDRSIAADRLPVFDYRITADVTDINGETRSSEAIVSIGYHSLNLGIAIPGKGLLTNDRDTSLRLSAANLAGIPQRTAVQLRIHRLQGPERLIRPRYWNAPDTFVMRKDEYLRHFPTDEYAQETRKEGWPVAETVLDRKDTVSGDEHRLHFTVSRQRPGWYRAEMTAVDAFGRPVKSVEHFRIADAATGEAEPFAYLTQTLRTPVAQPGDVPSVSLHTATDGLWVIQHVDPYRADKGTGQSDGKVASPRRAERAAPEDDGFRFIDLGRQSKTLEFPVREEDRGGFGIVHAFVRHNRFFSAQETVEVPWRNKDLDIRFSTYRDKTLPGSAEKWTVHVAGEKGDMAAAEVLLSMYDASLDQFLPHAWERPDLFERYPARNDRYLLIPWNAAICFSPRGAESKPLPERKIEIPQKSYDRLLWEEGYDFMTYGREGRMAGNRYMRRMAMAAPTAEARIVADSAVPEDQDDKLAFKRPGKTEEVVQVDVRKKTAAATDMGAQVRRDFRETAFFLPEMHTDSTGSLSFSFTMPEAVTRWKWQVLAHTKDLATGLAVRTVVTQKELMVQPNAPRFLREGDRLVLPARIANLSDREVSGSAVLELIDAETGKPVDGYFNNVFPRQYFTAAPRQGTVVRFSLTVPGNFAKPVRYRIVAEAEGARDGEEKDIPVLSNRVLVTEALPLQMKGLGSSGFRFEKLLAAAGSNTLTHHRLTLEYSTNPAWYAVQSLPYLTTYPYECAEQVFNRFYANSVAAKVSASTPKIRAYYGQWMKDSADGAPTRKGLLDRNADLRNILLEETPWVLDAKDEAQQLRDIAILFDLARISRESAGALERLRQAQTPNGGFSWFHGGPDDRYITQYILTGFGKLRQTAAIPPQLEEQVMRIVEPALAYLQKRMREDYEQLLRNKADMKKEQTGPLQIQCLYTLSSFPETPIAAEARKAYDFFSGQAAAFWAGRSDQLQGMTAILLHRKGDNKTPAAILNSLRERAVKDPALGMYWKNPRPAWYWQDARLETQALLVEAFTEIVPDDPAVDLMKQWLLTQKQTNRWESTRSTADACHALLMRGSDWLQADRSVTIKVGTRQPLLLRGDAGAEAGTGYFKSVIDGPSVRPDMGNIEVEMKGTQGKANSSISWGAAYWQYFERLEAIKGATSPLGLSKRLFVERSSPKGPVLEPIGEGASLKVGDRLIVRIELRSDRDMEYVHLKDMRASGSEPANVLSGYRWKGGLGYYESTRDAATSFFFSYLPKGTHVFEYPLFVSHAGTFAVGLASVECMYAPEFRSHSEGMELRVEQ